MACVLLTVFVSIQFQIQSDPNLLSTIMLTAQGTLLDWVIVLESWIHSLSEQADVLWFNIHDIDLLLTQGSTKAPSLKHEKASASHECIHAKGANLARVSRWRQWAPQQADTILSSFRICSILTSFSMFIYLFSPLAVFLYSFHLQLFSDALDSVLGCIYTPLMYSTVMWLTLQFIERLKPPEMSCSTGESTLPATDPTWSKPQPNPDAGCPPLPQCNKPLLYISDSNTMPCLKLLMMVGPIHLQAAGCSILPEGEGFDQVAKVFKGPTKPWRNLESE